MTFDPYNLTANDPSSLDHDPVSLTPEDIKEFQEIMKSECGVELCDQEAWNRAIELINFCRMLMGPIPEDPEAAGNAQSLKAEESVVTVPTSPEPPLPPGQLQLGI